MRKKSKLVHGVGINDANYVIMVNHTIGFTEDGKRIKKKLWICPYYARWKDMIGRCYSEKIKNKFKTYIDCQAVPEWHYFMNFRAWMEKQDWHGKVLDKDVLVPGNKVYGPETCIFVDQKVNGFVIDNASCRGDLPIGVWRKGNKFAAGCFDVQKSKNKYLGIFETPEEAHQAWLSFKLEQAKILASRQTDPRVAKALIERYENYVGLR